MNLNVIQRIFAGYSLLVLFLIAVAYAGIVSINGINASLKQVVEKAKPVDLLSAQIVSEIDNINLLMYQHYNSTELDQLTNYERNFDKYRNQLNSNAISLSKLLKEIDGSQQQVNLLTQLDSDAKAAFADIQQTMALYRNSIRGLSVIEGQISQINQLETQALSLFKQLDALPLPPNQKALIGRVETSIAQGISLAYRLALTENFTDFRAVMSAYSKWLAAFVELGFDLIELQQAYPVQAQTLKAPGLLISDLTWLVANVDGLGEVRGGYLSTKQTLATNVESNQQSLKQLKANFASISQFSARFSDEVAGTAADAVGTGQSTIIIFSVIAIVFGIAVAVLITNSIRTPLHRMISILERAATGDLSEDLTTTRSDEFGQLQQSAKALTDSLRHMIASIQQQAGVIAGSVDQAQDITEKNRSAIGEQRTQTDMVATAMNEMTMTIKEVSELAQNTFEEMGSVHESAQQTQAQVNSNRDLNSQLQHEMKAATDSIQALDQNVHKIEAILQVIETIAGQTNLLALNAAIEAARAGEHGRGFAVVADEVRTLASRTQQSTEEVKATIDTLLVGSTKAVDAINLSSDKTQEAVDMAATMERLIDEIAERVSHAKNMNMQIATAAEEQSATTEDMNQNIVRISDLAENTADGSESNAEKIGELHGASVELEQLVAKFKVNG